MDGFIQLLGEVRSLPMDEARLRVDQALAMGRIDIPSQRRLHIRLSCRERQWGDAIAGCYTALQDEPMALDLQLELSQAQLLNGNIGAGQVSASSCLENAHAAGNAAYVVEATMLLGIAAAKWGKAAHEFDLSLVPEGYSFQLSDSEWWMCLSGRVEIAEAPWHGTIGNFV